jgi:phosphonoacetate hydrolase
MGKLDVNGRAYALPQNPVVIVCVDGSEPGYIEEAIAKDRAPFFKRCFESGTSIVGHCVVPSFTNPNNLSIVTGVPPSVHGISGNYFLDPDTGKEVMMNDPKFLRAPTIFQKLQELGKTLAIVTAKDKLRALLGHGVKMAPDKAVCFSSEKSDKANISENGIDHVNDFVGMGVPDVYSAGLSEFVFAAGVKLMETMRPDVTYLSTTDYIQHKHAPGTPVADDFYAMMDSYLARLDALGATIVLTADHGMNAKHGPDGKPVVVYLQDALDDLLGKAAARVILPITDPYVVHHGALGSYAVVYLPATADKAAIGKHIGAIKGVDLVLTKDEAAAKFQLPPDRLGELVVVSSKHVTLGTSVDRHDLSGLKEPLRSHGGVSEQNVPLISNRKIAIEAGRTYRNFDAFDFALNRVAEKVPA